MSAWNGEQAAGASHWSSGEVDVGAFKDARLGRRFGDLLRRLSEGMGGSIPFACQDWTIFVTWRGVSESSPIPVRSEGKSNARRRTWGGETRVASEIAAGSLLLAPVTPAGGNPYPPDMEWGGNSTRRV